MTANKWFLPGFSVFLGLLCLAAFWAGGNPDDGVFALGLMTAIGVLVLVGGRSEMIRGLRGDGRDEYWERIDMRATLFSGVLTLAVIIGMCLWEWGHGRDGSPYTALGAIAGVAYLVGLAISRLRS
jgi:hypothetical protein